MKDVELVRCYELDPIFASYVICCSVREKKKKSDEKVSVSLRTLEF